MELDVDIFQPATYVRGFPHETFDRLRRDDPVHWTEESLSFEFPWAREPGPGTGRLPATPTFARVENAAGLLGPHRHDDARGAADPGVPEAAQQQQMLNMDPPQHTRLRLIVNRAFTPKAVDRLGDTIRDHCRRIVDDISAAGEAEFVRDVAAELPLLVLAELLGVPSADRDRLFDWSNRLAAPADPEYGLDFADFNKASREMEAYVDELSSYRRDHPGSDIWSSVVHAEVEGRRLTETELRMFWQLLVIAGNETTRNTLSNGLVALAEHPDQLADVRSDLSLVPSMVEEILRWVSPVIRFRRTATRDVELGGKKIAAGDKVVIYYPSANRDERVFTDPHRFDVRRTPNDHLAFGIGPHFCLGASLARLQLRTMFTELITRLTNIEIGEPVRLESSFISGIRQLPIRFSPVGGEP